MPYGEGTMSERTGDYERYLSYQASRRAERTSLLTTLVLATFDMGLLGEPESAQAERRTGEAIPPVEVAQPLAEVVEIRPRRERRLAGFAAEHAELGYADAA